MGGLGRQEMRKYKTPISPVACGQMALLFAVSSVAVDVSSILDPANVVNVNVNVGLVGLMKCAYRACWTFS